MIDNLNGLASVFNHMRFFKYSRAHIAPIAKSLCEADTGAAAVQRYMPEAYHATVNEAKRWLREQGAALA